MRIRKPLIASALALALTATFQVCASSALAEHPDSPQVTSAAPPGPVVTLITGDKIGMSVDDEGVERAVIQPADGRVNVTFTQIRNDAGHLSVIPGDARAGLASGQLDPRLFDVTGLFEAGYDDAHRATIPVLTKRATGSAPRLLTAPSATLPSLGIDVTSVPKDQARQLWTNLNEAGSGLRILSTGVSTVWLDAPRHALLDQSVPQIGADKAHERGLIGTGVTVAVLDTGVDTTHPDLAVQVAESVNFTDSATTGDKVGHGTHVASTIAGTGAASDGKYAGVAPGATLLNGKVLNDRGQGSDSWVLAGMEWAAVTKHADIISMSLGGTDTQGIDPLEQAVNDLSASTGALFVIAAGNEGRTGDRTIGSPGSAESALTVGAVDRNDELADFSSRGPRIGDYGVKPDVTAPGVGIVAARATGTNIGDPVDANYTALSGTSMATPHVAGAAALLKQQHPGWTGQQLKAALIGTAKHIDGYSAFEQGAGRIDVDRATTQVVTASPANLNTYLPYGGPTSATNTLTYTNSGDTDVRLKLDSHSWTRDGKKTNRLVDLDDRKFTVPAHGSVNVDVTIGGRGVKPGVYSGMITAEGAGQQVSSIVGAYIEPEAGDLTATFLRHDGTPQTNLVATVVNLATGDSDYLLAGNGIGSLHLAAGKYTLITNIIDKVVKNGKTLDAITPVIVPVEVEPGMAPVVVDTAKGAELNGDVDVDDSTLLDRTFAVTFTGESRHHAQPVQVSHGSSFQGQVPMYVMPFEDPDVAYEALFTFGKPKSNRYGTRSPFRVDAAVYKEGEVPSDASYHGKTADMAYVDTNIVSHGDSIPMMYAGALFPDGSAIALNRTFHTTGALPHYVDYPEGVDQYRYLVQQSRRGGANVQADTDHRYERGQTYHETWFGFVLGPKVASGDAYRDGDTIHVEPRNLYTDYNLDHTSEDSGGYGTMTLSKDGETVASQEFATVFPPLETTVPAGEGRYSLNIHDERPAWWWSNGVDVTWTFDSRRTHDKTDLPLTTFRTRAEGLTGPYATTPTTNLTLFADGSGDRTPKMRNVTVEVSADESSEWTSMPVTKTDDGWAVTVTNPAQTNVVTFVNLRISGEDKYGNTVTQTVYGAYLMQQ